MKFASKSDTIPAEGKAAVYRVRVPTKRDKIELRRRARAAGARRHDDTAFISRVGVVIERVLKDDPAESARLLDIVKRFAEERARLEETVGASVAGIVRAARSADSTAAEIDAAVKDNIAELQAFVPLAEDYARVERLAEELDQGLRDMRADNEAFWPIYNLEAAQLLLAGWEAREGYPLPAFRYAAGRVPAELIEALPDEDIGAIGTAVLLAMAPTETERKNSASPPGTPPGGEASTDGSAGPETPQPPKARDGSAMH